MAKRKFQSEHFPKKTPQLSTAWPSAGSLSAVGEMAAKKSTGKFNSIEAVLRDIARGQMVVVVDDADRENEGDLIMAAEKTTAKAVNFMAKFGRGLICVPTVPERLHQLGIERMVLNNRESHRTDFQISVDAANGITTGISAADRAKTIKVLSNPTSIADDLVQPGHIFPLRAKSGGVLQRAGPVSYTHLTLPTIA